MKRVVLYARVSSDSQEEKGSIRTQIASAKRYCEQNSLTLTEQYLDDGETSRIPLQERPAGSRLIADAKAGKFDHLLIWKLDRIERDTRHTLNTLEYLSRLHVSVVSLSESIDTSTPTGLFFVTNLAAMNQLTRDNIRDNSRRGQERLVREGRWTGGRPAFGYQVVDGRLALDPIQSPIVKQIFEWYLGGKRVRGIGVLLNATGIKHPMDWTKDISRPWWDATVSNLLKNPIYTGVFTWRKRTDRKKIAGKHTCTKTAPDQQIIVSIPAIVSKKDFDRVQNTLVKNRSDSFRNAKHNYLLRTLMFCGECGYRYVGLTSGRKPWIKNYYRCSSHVGSRNRPPCRGKAIRADLLEKLVWDSCVSFALDPSPIIEELKRTMEYQQDNQGETREYLSSIQVAISAKGAERERVTTLHRKGLISDAEVERQLVSLKHETEGLEKERGELAGMLQAAEHSEYRILTAETMLNFLADKVSSADDNVKREVMLHWIEKVTVTTKGEGKAAGPVAHVRFVFRSPSSSEAVDCVEPALAYSPQLTVSRTFVM